MAKVRTNTPYADCLMGSLRSMGYTFESAIADVIDNSISAECNFVQLFFPTNPLEISVCILDDGWGMSEDELFDAMRYGSSASENIRSEADLGRFGLGLKSASLSQCRKLTVVSKRKDTGLSAFQWDYNFIQEQRNWNIKQFDENEIQALPYINNLNQLSSGTLVIWEDFDFMEKSSGSIYNTLCDYKQNVSEYISLIFHRFITTNKVIFRLNHHTIEAKDPFLENHRKTTLKKEIDLVLPDSAGIERHIKIQPYILPFVKDLSEKDIQKLGGVESIKMRQGFYIYRNNRLIIWGTWFGRKKEELTKNARIRVDIPNTLDDIWEIDVKKQNATIPRRILNQLTAKVNEVMDIAVRQQTHRGRKNKVNEETEYIWNRIEGRSRNFFYEVNREHELYRMIKKNVSEEALKYFELFLEEIEKNIPFQQMYIDQSRNAIDENNSDERNNEIFIKACMMIDMSVKFGNTMQNAIDVIMKSEPFCRFEDLRLRLETHYKL